MGLPQGAAFRGGTVPSPMNDTINDVFEKFVAGILDAVSELGQVFKR